jgi:hypothetical protein
MRCQGKISSEEFRNLVTRIDKAKEDECGRILEELRQNAYDVVPF